MNRNMDNGGEKVFVSWSGGKDSYLAFLKARESGLRISALVTFLNHNGRSMSHGVTEEILRRQAAGLGVPLESEPVTWNSYEEGFSRVTERLKKKGISGGVFGDINVEDHRQWIENMCAKISFTSHLPLWGMAEKEVVRELLRRGARLLVVSLRGDLLDKQWLGKVVDESFMRMCLRRGITPCGEKGEYHTLVVDGPSFKMPLQYKPGSVVEKDGRYFLQVIAAD